MEKFIKLICDNILEETNVKDIKPNTVFKDLDEWDSMCVMLLIGMADSLYNKSITGEEISKCKTIKDLYALID